MQGYRKIYQINVEKKTKKTENYFKNFKLRHDHLDLVYIIYSTDNWRTFKYKNTCHQKNSSQEYFEQSTESIIKTHEFFIDENDKSKPFTLQMVVCHQINEKVSKHN